MKWRIYYGDGSTVDDTELNPFDVPGLNVQAIVQADEDVGRYVLHRMDFYWWVPEDNEWNQSDQFGLWDYLQRPGPKKVVFGRSLNNIDYKRILALAIKDKDFNPVSGEMPR